MNVQSPLEARDRPRAAPTTRFLSKVIDGYRTGLLCMEVNGRAVLSIPSQLGCAVGCRFCVSRDTPLVRNLTADEMLDLVRAGIAALPRTGMPIELSFTGEGEPCVNWKQAARVCEQLEDVDARFTSVRYCFSGLGAPQLLGRLQGGVLPMRLQMSLHAAREETRRRLVPNTCPLELIEAALLNNAHRFAAVELNVVLQDGVNDSASDLDALARFGDPAWPILLSPLLGEDGAIEGVATDWFETELRARGRAVKRYRALARQISTRQVYPRLTAIPVAMA